MNEQINLNSNLTSNNVDINIRNSNLLQDVDQLQTSNSTQSNQIYFLLTTTSEFSNQIHYLTGINDELEFDLLQERSNLSQALEKIEILEGTAYASEFGYLANYALVFNDDNSAHSIINAELFIGLNFDVVTPPSRAIIKHLTPLFGLSNDGSVTLFDQEDIDGQSNVDIASGSINILMNPDERGLHVIPLHAQTNTRDAFPVNILDVTTHEGSRKFKSDFDNVGSLLYSRDGIAFSGLNALCGFVQLSDSNLHAQTTGRDESIFLQRNEIIVDFIAYYHLPLLFEHVKDHNELVQYNFYTSSLVENRLDDKVYKVLSGQSSIETVNHEQVEIQNTVLGNYNVSFYPHIRVIKWQNEYEAAFDYIGNRDKSDELLTALGWGNPMNVSTIVNKYINTNNGSNWINKLTELTFAHLKYGKPLKTLNTADMNVVNTISSMMTMSSDPDSYFVIQTLHTEITFKIKKEAFSGYLY